MTTKSNLLIVDADPKSLRVLEVSLRKAGYTITTAENGKEALDKVRIAAPDLIISNTVMPEMDGFEFLKALKADTNLAAIPFIFLTSHKAIEDKIKGLELGVEDYLTKPIFVREILTRVNMLLQRRDRESLERRGTKTKFSGRLSDMGIVDLIQTIDIGRKTGIIHLNNGKETGAIFFRDGKVIDAEVGARRGADAVYRFLFWSDGSFEIDFRNVRREARIELSTQGLLMEGMRRVDEWGYLIEQLPSLDLVLDVSPERLLEKLDTIPDEVNEVLRHFDGKKTLMEVVDASIMGDVETLGVVVKLYQQGLLSHDDAKAVAPSVGEILSKTDGAQVAQFPGPAREDTDEHTLPPVFRMRSATDPEQRFRTDDGSRWDLTPTGIPTPFAAIEAQPEAGPEEAAAEPIPTADPEDSGGKTPAPSSPKGSFSPALALRRRKRRQVRKATAPLGITAPRDTDVEAHHPAEVESSPAPQAEAPAVLVEAPAALVEAPAALAGAWKPVVPRPSSLMDTHPGGLKISPLSQTRPMAPQSPFPAVPEAVPPPRPEEAPEPEPGLEPAPAAVPGPQPESELPSIIVTDEQLRQRAVQTDNMVWKDPEEDASEDVSETRPVREAEPAEYTPDPSRGSRIAVIVLIALIVLSAAGYGAYYYFYLVPEKALLAVFEAAERKDRSDNAEVTPTSPEPVRPRHETPKPAKAVKAEADEFEDVPEAKPAPTPQPDPQAIERYNQFLKEAQGSGARKKAELYREALTAYPAGHEAMVRLAALLMEDEDTRGEALALAEKGVSLAPSSSLGWLVIGYLKQVKDDTSGSAEAYGKCAEITPPDRYTRECKLMLRSLRR